MPSKSEIISQLLQRIEFSIDKFHNSAPYIQNKLFNRFVKVLGELSLDRNGNVKPTVKNLRLVNKLSTEFRREILNSNWTSNVEGLEGDILKIQALQVKYFNTIEKGYEASAFMREMSRQTMIGLKEKLLDDGLNANVVSKLGDLIRKNITDGVPFGQLVNDMSVFIKGDKERLGRLQSYSSQIVNDGLNQYAASINKAFTDDLGLEWFQYVGSIVKDSRPWCVAMVNKQFIHVSELTAVTNGNINGGQISLKGLIPGTNALNVQVNRGGYNCNHLMLPVSSEAVPLSLRNKFNNNL